MTCCSQSIINSRVQRFIRETFEALRLFWDHQQERSLCLDVHQYYNNEQELRDGHYPSDHSREQRANEEESEGLADCDVKKLIDIKGREGGGRLSQLTVRRIIRERSSRIVLRVQQLLQAVLVFLDLATSN